MQLENSATLGRATATVSTPANSSETVRHLLIEVAWSISDSFITLTVKVRPQASQICGDFVNARRTCNDPRSLGCDATCSGQRLDSGHR